ncbi:unnamed protein product, partial [Iphiclides podalirius]
MGASCKVNSAGAERTAKAISHLFGARVSALAKRITSADVEGGPNGMRQLHKHIGMATLCLSALGAGDRIGGSVSTGRGANPFVAIGVRARIPNEPATCSHVGDGASFGAAIAEGAERNTPFVLCSWRVEKDGMHVLLELNCYPPPGAGMSWGVATRLPTPNRVVNHPRSVLLKPRATFASARLAKFDRAELVTDDVLTANVISSVILRFTRKFLVADATCALRQTAGPGSGVEGALHHVCSTKEPAAERRGRDGLSAPSDNTPRWQVYKPTMFTIKSIHLANI